MIPLRCVSALTQNPLPAELTQPFVKKIASKRRGAHAPRRRLRIKQSTLLAV
jgi:hypothetical protein